MGSVDLAAGVGSATKALPIRHRRSKRETVAQNKKKVRDWLIEHKLLLENGEHARSLLTSDPDIISKLLMLLKSSRLEIVQLRAAQADQVDAEKALREAGFEGLFDLLSQAVLNGKYPLRHGIWSRLFDMLENM